MNTYEQKQAGDFPGCISPWNKRRGLGRAGRSCIPASSTGSSRCISLAFPILPRHKPSASSFHTCTVCLGECCLYHHQIRVPARQAPSCRRAPAPVLGCQPDTMPCPSPAGPCPARSTTLPAWLWWGFFQDMFPNTSSLPPSTLCSRRHSRCCSTDTPEHFLVASSLSALDAPAFERPELLFRTAENSFLPQPEKTLNPRI